jgi:hypothetical protein
LYFSSDRTGTRNIWRVAISGGSAEQITFGGAWFRTVMAPDGSELFYKAHEGDGPLLAIPATGGSTPRQVLPCATNGYTTNRTALYYIDCGPGPEYAVRLHEGKTSPDRVLGHTPGSGLNSPLTVSPDGKVVLVLRGGWTTSLAFIENFR